MCAGVKTLKPQHLRRHSETREAIWETIRELKEFTIPDIALNCDLAYNTIFRYVSSLARAGILEVDRSPGLPSYLGSAAGRRHLYRLLRDSFEPPRVREDGSEIDRDKGTQRMWNTIRNRKTFNLSDLHALSSTARHPVARSAAAQYLKYLEYAGYVRRVEGAELSRATYRLVNNTGPKAPMVQRVRQVWDQNLRRVMWPPLQEESSDGNSDEN